MRHKKLSIGLMAILAIFTVALFVTSTWGETQEKVLHSFNNNGTDGYSPQARLISDAAGNLYGTAGGGTYNYGTVFELTPTADGSWTEKILYSFNHDGTDGVGPTGSLIIDNAGNLYGTTAAGGIYCPLDYGCGTVFELTRSPSAAGGGWKEKVLHSFGNGTDGSRPQAGLIFDAAGNLYGTTGGGGTYEVYGTVFELTPTAGGGWTEKVLHNFNGTDGAHSYAGLIQDAAGNLYGTTYDGGTYGFGTAFELTRSPRAGGGGWTEKVLHNFENDGTDGTGPYAGLIWDAAGNLYGTTVHGGTCDCPPPPGGYGTVFELTPTAGGGWTEKVLYSFDGREAWNPSSELIRDAAGNLYGTTPWGGTYTRGSVFEMTPTADGGWMYSVFYSFNSNGTDGYNPMAGLIRDPAGNFYGTTQQGGIYNWGTVFQITP
jgi:uncharacterized repeat protein (TIGR03803 family)